MAFYGVVYTLDRNEDFDSFVQCLGLPEEQTAAYIDSKPSQKIEQDGDTYVITTISPNGTTEVKFQDGVEFDEPVTPEINSTNVITVDGNVFTQVKTVGDRTITLVREYTPEELVVTLTASFWDGTAKRYYVAN